MVGVEWNFNDYLLGKFRFDEFKVYDQNKIACFDLDGTLISCKSGKKYPIDENDWSFFSDSVVKDVQYYHENQYQIVIVTNQSGLTDNEKRCRQWKIKLENIVSIINVPIIILSSTSHDKYRKPLPSFWDVIEKTFIKKNVDKSKSFYCGDACGRPLDHSDCDLKFALNSGVKFYTPEELFNKAAVKIPQIIYPVHDEIKKFTQNNNQVFVKKDKEIILLVGLQGSGKSTYSDILVNVHGYVRINQDTLKTKSKCLTEAKKQMGLDASIVVDNTNSSKDTRAEYIKLAQKYNYTVRCFVFDVSLEFAMHNTTYRMYKYDKTSIPKIAYAMYKKYYVEPKKEEGIDSIEKIHPYIEKYESDYLMFLL